MNPASPAADAPDSPMTPLRRYTALAEARVAGLALAAREIVYQIDREGDEWELKVEAQMSEAAETELRGLEEEQAQTPPPPAPRSLGRIRLESVWAAALLLAAFYLAQQAIGPSMLTRGEADAGAILHGAWWRCVTALTLHGDASHLISNLAFGALFTAFLIPQFGAGRTWLLTVLSGALGNAINAWGYRGEDHHSIGASTAVFGALGLLVGVELFFRWISPSTRSRWQLIVPLGGGLALLAYLGVGEKHGDIDFMAHCWGFISGLLLGLLAPVWRLEQPEKDTRGWLFGLAAIALLGTAWTLAWRHG